GFRISPCASKNLPKRPDIVEEAVVSFCIADMRPEKWLHIVDEVVQVVHVTGQKRREETLEWSLDELVRFAFRAEKAPQPNDATVDYELHTRRLSISVQAAFQ